MEGILAFRLTIMELVGKDPFQKAITIASWVNWAFRAKFLKPNTIAIIPDNVINPKVITSYACMLWLKWIS